MAKAAKISSHTELIRRYTRIFNEYGETRECLDAIFDDLLENISDEIHEFWDIFFHGIAYQFTKKYNKSYTTLRKLDKTIESDSLLFCFVTKEKLFSYALTGEQNIGESINRYNGLIEKFKDEKSTGIKLQVAQMMLYKEIITSKINDEEECLILDDEIIKTYRRINQKNFVLVVIKAMLNKAWTLEHLGRRDESQKIYKKIISSYKKHTDKTIKQQVAKAMYLLAFNPVINTLDTESGTLGLLSMHLRASVSLRKPNTGGKKADALSNSIKIFSEITKRYSKSKSLMLRATVLHALYYQGCCYVKLSMHNEAIKIFGTLLKKYDQLLRNTYPDVFNRTKAHIFNAIMKHSKGNEEIFWKLVEDVYAGGYAAGDGSTSSGELEKLLFRSISFPKDCPKCKPVIVEKFIRELDLKKSQDQPNGEKDTFWDELRLYPEISLE